MTRRDEAVQAARTELLAQGAAPGASIHGWRCEYPDRYAPCDCVDEAARDITATVWPLAYAAALADAAEAVRGRRHPEHWHADPTICVQCDRMSVAARVIEGLAEKGDGRG